MSSLIGGIKPHSLAAELDILPGDELVGVNGMRVQDVIEFSYLTACPSFEMQICRKGQVRTLNIEKDLDEDLGLEFESAVFDKVALCHNHCIFCFVDQMIPGMRKGLYVRDDDFRLSFLYGNFITLTNLTDTDFQRIIQTHMSPLYVSVHATNPELRCSMMGNKNAGDVLEKLRYLLDAGIEIHTQIVCCPDYNDGKELIRTVNDLRTLAPGIASVAIVPVGLTKHREHLAKLRTFTAEEAKNICSSIAKIQKQCRNDLGKTFVYLADEFYLLSGVKIPPAETYDNFPQIENGIGLTRYFLEEWQQNFVLPKSEIHENAVIIVGEGAAPILMPLINQFNKKYDTKHKIVGVKNKFFGGAVNVTGLLSGGDILDAVRDARHIILPAVVLNKDNLFLDDMSLESFKQQCRGKVEIARNAADLIRLL